MNATNTLTNDDMMIIARTSAPSNAQKLDSTDFELLAARVGVATPTGRALLRQAAEMVS